MPLSRLKRALSQDPFIYFTESLSCHPSGQGLGNSFGLQFRLQPFAPHRPNGQPFVDPSLCIGVIVEVPEVRQSVNRLCDLKRRGSFRSEKLFNLGDRPISFCQETNREANDINRTRRNGL